MGGCALGAGDGATVGASVSVGADSGVAVGASVSVGVLAIERDAKTALGVATSWQAASQPIPITALVRIQIFPVFKFILYSL